MATAQNFCITTATGFPLLRQDTYYQVLSGLSGPFLIGWFLLRYPYTEGGGLSLWGNAQVEEVGAW